MGHERYCVCRTKKSDGFMVGCARCEEWFHIKCINFTKKQVDSMVDYYCDECTRNDPKLKINYKSGFAPPPEKKPNTVKQEPLEERKQEKKFVDRSQGTSSAAKLSKQKTVVPVPPKAGQVRRKVGQKAKSKSHRKQCANHECVYEARQLSKYCSDECGYAFNKLRYETYFVPNYKAIEANHSHMRLLKMQDMARLEEDKNEVEKLIKDLKTEKEELEQNIKKIKDEAKRLYKEQAIMKENNEDDAEADNEDTEEVISGDASKTFCITCGMTIQSTDKAFKHWASCHKKHEASYNFTADMQVNYTSSVDENPKLYCHHQDKKTKRYCMHIESACPQHSNWHSDKDEVCGCPSKIMQTLEPRGDYCLELKKDCTQHYHWDKFRLAQINMQRIHAFSRLDAINERRRLVEKNLDDTYGGIVGVMLHKTINYV